MSTPTTEKPTNPLTQQFTQQACKTFRDRCYSQHHSLQSLYNQVTYDIAKELSETLTPEQALLLLSEHPNWIKERGNSPGGTIATIVSDCLASLLRSTINERWAELLLKQ